MSADYTEPCRKTLFRLDDIQNAAINFVDKLKPTDSVMVMSFDDRIEVLCKATTDRNTITKAIGRTRTGGGTRFTWIAEELGRQYSIGYYPSTTGNEGERRQKSEDDGS